MISCPDIPSPPGGQKVRLIAIPRLAQGGRWRVEAMRSLTEPMLLWFTRGQGRITVAGNTRGYGAHNAIFVPALTMHGFEVSQQVYGTALFFGSDTDQTLPQTQLHLRIRDAAPQNELTSLLENIRTELDGKRPGHDRAARHYIGLLGVWLERQAATSADLGQPDAARRLIARFTALLERDFRSGRGVADYAQALGVTPTHLTRTARQSCGRSASQLLHDRLLFEARRLLVETRMPVKAVSESLGFTSPAYFTRAFQHGTGKTPTAFRRAG